MDLLFSSLVLFLSFLALGSSFLYSSLILVTVSFLVLGSSFLFSGLILIISGSWIFFSLLWSYSYYFWLLDILFSILVLISIWVFSILCRSLILGLILGRSL